MRYLIGQMSSIVSGYWPLSERLAVIALLAIQAGLLAFSATRHSPTYLEPAFLASGISHWHFGQFELYRVNPPLVRMVAALPVLGVDYKTDWSRLYDAPGSRAEYSVGEDFVKANGSASTALFVYARWACIPFALIGGYFAYRWARDLFGAGAGLFTLALWTFEPNLLAHAELITPDSACTSFGIAAGYWFWKWLRSPSWTHVCLAGVFLGLAELSKMTWVILFALWPLLWGVWRIANPQARTVNERAGNEHLEAAASHSSGALKDFPPPAHQLVIIAALALYLLNLGYAFDGTFTTPLKDLQFVSTVFTGLNEPGLSGNRFRETWLGELPLLVPKQYVLGLDSQKKDFEHYSQPSYLRGEWKDSGWWYYYIYGLLVKVPCGTWGLFILVVARRLIFSWRTANMWDEMILLAPLLAVLVLVSSQTGFNHHLRYAFPGLGLSLIFLGQAVNFPAERFRRSDSGTNSSRPLPAGLTALSAKSAIALAAYSVISALIVYPHHLSYFNEAAGGPKNGWKHLLGSSFDWGQDLLYYFRQSTDIVERIDFACYTSYDPLALIATRKQPRLDAKMLRKRPDHRHYVVLSTNILRGGIPPPRPTDGIPAFGTAEYHKMMAAATGMSTWRVGNTLTVLPVVPLEDLGSE